MLVGLAALERRVNRLPAAQRALIEQVVSALVERDPVQLGRLSRLMHRTDRKAGDQARERRELEAQNLVRVLTLANEVERQSLKGEQLGVSRQRLNQLRQEGKLLGVKLPMHREFLYPRWQFGKDARVLPALPRLLSVAREAGLDGLDLHLLMTSSRRRGEKPLVDRLRAGGPHNERYLAGVIRGSGG
jgi:hypothetical protein